ncbi:hypothetical protein KJ885_05755 [Patescibacteria group bacterium]|nr:hypothetical protein [Patescibacteria group bacterium]
MFLEIMMLFFGICLVIGQTVVFVLTFVWTLPNTLIGLFTGFFLTFGRPKWKYGCWIFASGKGISKYIKNHALAITFGYVVICWEPKTSKDKRVLVHEKHHVSQYKILGPFFLPIYAFLLILSKGSQGTDHPLERGAYEKMDEYVEGHAVVKKDVLYDVLHAALGFLLAISTLIYLVSFF